MYTHSIPVFGWMQSHDEHTYVGVVDDSHPANAVIFTLHGNITLEHTTDGELWTAIWRLPRTLMVESPFRQVHRKLA